MSEVLQSVGQEMYGDSTKNTEQSAQEGTEEKTEGSEPAEGKKEDKGKVEEGEVVS